MRCEVVAIGTELLLGQIVDTNSSWIGEQLATVGIDSFYQVKVGDNFGRMESAIRGALERADAVICCGGLGPTQDDITRDVLAHIMGVPLVRDEAIVEKIRAGFEARGRVMTDNNRRQADIPDGATTIPQMPGTAPGMMCPVGDKVVYAVPGVPYEMQEMVLGTVLPDLQRRAGQPSVIRSRTLRTWGQSESGLAEILAERIAELDEVGNPTLAFNASGIEGIKVRITAKASDEAGANTILADEEGRLRGLLGPIVFGVDGDSMETVVLRELRRRGQTLAVAEILTGGILASRITDIEGAGEVFLGAMIFPDGEAFAAAGPNARDRAIAAAQQVRQAYGADFGVAAVAPKEEEGLPRGTALLAISTAEGDLDTKVALPGDKRRFRNYAVISLADFLRKTLEGRS